MKSYFPTLTILMFVSLVSACSTITHVEQIGNNKTPLEKDCEVTVIEKTKLLATYEVLGKIETHIKGNIFFGGSVKTNDEGYKELRAKSCALGGNAFVIDDSMETSSAEMRHVHIWARVFNIPKAL
ncbi:MAG: hypothetical protein K2P84_01335 [Undibacterium sp.]|nr:hypothetical protein [Undibacterium sp.]